MTGISQSNPSRQFVILSDNDIYLETLDIRANLRMCERYDCVTGFSKIVDLTKEDSRGFGTRKRHEESTSPEMGRQTKNATAIVSFSTVRQFRF